jgi:hypothetical protein
MPQWPLARIGGEPGGVAVEIMREAADGLLGLHRGNEPAEPSIIPRFVRKVIVK